MKPISLFVLIILAISAAAFIVIKDVINDLGIKHSNAQNYILKNLVGNFDAAPIESDPVEDRGADEASASLDAQMKSFKIPYGRNLKNVVTGDRAALAREVCGYVKEYINSEEFIAAYSDLRAKTKPVSEPPRLSAAEIENIEKSLIQGEKALAQAAGYMTKQQLTAAKKAIAEQKLQLKQQKDPTPNKTKWERMYPSDPAVMVRKRLQEYIALAATVDFKAEITGSGGNRTFVNPAYEAKPVKWKVIYRAGKDVNDVVTSFVKQWLAGEIIAKEKTSMAKYTDLVISKNVKNDNAAGNKKRDADEDFNEEDNENIAAGRVKEVKSLLKKAKQKIIE